VLENIADYLGRLRLALTLSQLEGLAALGDRRGSGAGSAGEVPAPVPAWSRAPIAPLVRVVVFGHGRRCARAVRARGKGRNNGEMARAVHGPLDARHSGGKMGRMESSILKVVGFVHLHVHTARMASAA
jgi:hypothetical protein